MATDYFTVITKKGRALEATSKATAAPINFTHIAVGDGGGAPVIPSAEMESLRQERWRGEINDLYVDPDNPDVMVAEVVIPETAGGFVIREAGLFTDTGILYAVGNVPPSPQPILSEGAPTSVYLRMKVIVSSEANVTLLIDPAKVLATRQYVDGEIDKIELEVKRVEDDLSEAIIKVEDGLSEVIFKHDKKILEEGVHGFAMGKEGQILTVRNGKLAWTDQYPLCIRVYNDQIHPDLEPGFQPCFGGLITGADVKFPRAFEYLLSVAGQKICVTEAQWQIMNRDVFRKADGTPIMLADGTSPSWDGIGGAPRYVIDPVAKTIRLPDVRGMYAEAAGFDLLDVGGVHPDGIRNLFGEADVASENGLIDTSGTTYAVGFFAIGRQATQAPPATRSSGLSAALRADASRVVPVGNKVAPRAYGVLPCVYLGKPTS